MHLGIRIEHRESVDPGLFLASHRVLNHDYRLTAAVAMLALVRLTKSDYEVLVEPDRIRGVPFSQSS